MCVFRQKKIVMATFDLVKDWFLDAANVKHISTLCNLRYNANISSHQAMTAVRKTLLNKSICKQTNQPFPLSPVESYILRRRLNDLACETAMKRLRTIL